ncbi:hypothetical protein PHMEG_00015142 [Phytophthora megakarya]|uniref:CCHC-type domain-containing protein n=1 Tax=Phytophthora megakarya TaxID=4795 RepID=A0A225W325_9STRA|nr:hypothetical protein PHMEG_00015142 [Phytophthora megakarya]
MTEGKPSIYRFLQSAFSSEQIKELRQTCEIRYGFPSHLRKPTEIESTIIRGLLEGTILCPRLPDFLKRICDPQAYRKSQNTIKAQVEGDLILKLYPEFKIYPQFQTRKRLTREFLLGINNSSNDPAKVTAMLQEAKQICYDQGQHAIHLIFWTREMASKWSKEFTVLNFRNRRFPVRNAHEAEYGTPIDSEDRSKVIWGRQVGADGIRNELPRDRYHVRLLNLSRYLDEAAIDAYIQTQFQGVYHTWQEPTTAGQIPQTDTWDIFFRCNHCPQFLDGIRFINWEDTKILVHHVTRNAASPCFSCGANGHMRTVCKVSDDFLKSQYSLRVMAEDIEALPRQQSTITSVEELEQLWTKDQQDTNTVMKTEIANQQVDKKSTKQILKRKDNCSTGLTLTQQPDNEWKTAGKHNGKSKILGTEDPSTYRTEVEEDGGNERKTDSGEDGKQTFGTDAGKAQVEAQGPRGIGRTITEEIHRATRDSSSAMMKQKELMEKLIGEKREKTEEGVYDACLHIDVEKYPNEAVSGLQVLQDCGLEQVATPRTGNCQYYAVAMALLEKDFSKQDDVAPLENLTGKIKRGITAAANHFFEQEYPHDERMRLLKDLARREGVLDARNSPKLTAIQSKTQYQEYIVEQSKTTSKLDTRIPVRYWGSTETLRMMAKILRRPIFTVDARKGMRSACYTIFEPADVKVRGKEYFSAKERMMDVGKPRRWIKALQLACKPENRKKAVPIVLLYSGNHYTRLRFTGNQNGNGCKEEIKEESQMEIGSNAQTLKEVFSLANERKMEDQVDDEDELMEEKQQTHSQDEQNEIDQHGGEKYQVLQALPAQGLEGMTPGKRAELRVADLTMADTVRKWVQEFNVTPAVIHDWHHHLNFTEPSPTFTSSQASETSNLTSEWTSSERGEASQSDQGEKSLNSNKNGLGTGRFFGENISLGTNRLKEQVLKMEWNELSTTWQETQASFPTIPMDIAQWKNVVRIAPEKVMALLQKFQSPDYILSAMTDAVLDEWTLSYRRKCLVGCIGKLIATERSVESKKWLHEWKIAFEDREKSKNDPYNIYARSFWGPMKKQKFLNSELLKLCRETNRHKLSRMVLAAFIYRPELSNLAGTTGNIPGSLIEHLDLLFETLEMNPELHAAIHGVDTVGCWAVLETKFAKTIATQTESSGDLQTEQ